MFEKMIKSSIYGLTAIFFAVFFHYLGWLAPIENLVVRTVAPVQGFFYGVSRGWFDFYDDWLIKRNLLGENEYLRGENIKLQSDLSRLKALEEENEILKKELNFIEEKKYSFVSAKIITGISDSLSQSVIINRGSRDGLEPGLAVVAESGILIGKIIEAGADYSKVLLLKDSKSKVAVTIQNLDHTVGLVEGQYGLSFSMTNIPQNQDIKEGDLVVTSGLEGKIPKNLLVAKVASIKSIESEIFKTAILTPILNFDNLSNVLVIIP